jgi:hypothetical protein
VTILTTFHNSWSIQKVQAVLSSASSYMISTAKWPVMDQGIIFSLNPKPGDTLNEVTVELAKNFYK